MVDRMVTGLRARSPVSGLDRRTLPPMQVFAQSVSAMAPSAAMAATPAIVAASAGQAVLWSFAVATVAALLIGVCIAQFTRRMAAAGSLYSLTAKGLGPVAAFACACALLVGYALLAMAALVGAGIFLNDLLSRVGIVPDGNSVAVASTVLLLAGGTTLFAVRGIRLSARVILVIESISIGLMLVVFLVLMTDFGFQFDSRPFALPDMSVSGLAAGVLPALGAFIGFEAAAALGVEAHRPYQTIPRSVQWTAAFGGILYLVAAYVQMRGFGDKPGGLAGQSEPLVALATDQHVPWLLYLLDIGIAASFVACALAATNALARVLFSLARDHVAPACLGNTHRRHRTPQVAIFTAAPVVALTPIVVLAMGESPTRTLMTLLNVASFGFLVAYLLVCLAAPVFLKRIGELTATAIIASAVIGPVLLAAVAAFIFATLGGPYPSVFALLAAVSVGWFGWLRVRRPHRIPDIGVYDETSIDDVLIGTRETRA